MSPGPQRVPPSIRAAPAKADFKASTCSRLPSVSITASWTDASPTDSEAPAPPNSNSITDEQRLAAGEDQADLWYLELCGVVADHEAGVVEDLIRHGSGLVFPALIGHLVDVAVVTGEIATAVDLHDELSERQTLPTGLADRSRMPLAGRPLVCRWVGSEYSKRSQQVPRNAGRCLTVRTLLAATLTRPARRSSHTSRAGQVFRPGVTRPDS